MAVTIPMRIVIGGMVAAIVLIVAVVTLVITYSVALTSVRDIAEKYAVSLVQTAQANAENFIDHPRRDLETVQQLFRRPGFGLLPSEEPDINTWQNKFNDILQHVILGFNRSYSSLGIIWSEGSAISVSNIDYPTNLIINFQSSNMATFNTTGSGPYVAHNHVVDWDVPSMRWVAAPIRSGAFARGDSRFVGYYQALDFFDGPRGFWFPMQVFVPHLRPIFLLPCAARMFSASGRFLGLFLLTVEIGEIEGFLRSAQTEPGIEAFLVDSARRVIGATKTDKPYFRSYWTTSTAAPPGCATSATTALQDTNHTVVCFTKAVDYAYAPLAQALADHPALLVTSGTAGVLADIDGDGKYYVVSGAVVSRMRAFGLNIVLTMPEELVVGNLRKGRNTAIGATVAIFIVASATAFLLVFILLRPLSAISKQMHDTARLREKEDQEQEFSNLTEVRNLQKSYYNMNSAIQSFTRYVPRDVVTDLMSSGQLCEIKMAEMYCSMLFTDIQGFTTVCERVPVDALSRLVSQYFDVMSHIVMDHDGLIDKYIGDCIMAVWGAPFPLANHEFKCTLAGLLLNRETLVDPICGAFDEAGEVLGIRVGINSGVVLAGNMGSSQRMNYTVIGDAVNLAARLESMNKQFGTRVMISEETAAPLGNIFCLRLLMSIAVVGKAQPVKVYDVVGISRNVPESDRTRLREHDDEQIRKGQHDPSGSSQLDGSAISNDTYISSAGPGAFGRRHDSNVLLTEALTSTQQSDAPVMVAEVDAQFAAAFTEAVNAYLNQHFGRALEAIRAMEQTFDVDVVGTRSFKQKSKTTSPQVESLALTKSSEETGPSPSSKAQNRRLRGNVIPERSFDILDQLAQEAIADPTKFKGHFTAAEK